MKRNAIFHGISAVCSALVYAFFALPFVSVKTVIASKATVESTNGYKFLEQALKASNGTGNAKFATIMALILLIVAGIVLLSSVLALICDFGVIKNALVTKIVNWIAFASAALLVLFAILNLIANANYVSKDLQANFDKANKLAGIAGAKITATAGWLMTIITTLLSIGSLATCALPIFSKNSKQKKIKVIE